MSGEVPETVPCPCGNGCADRRRKQVSRPNRRFRRKIIHHYRHAGCHIGGYIVTLYGNPISRGGPLFDKGRYNQEFSVRAPVDELAADGGSIQ